MSVKILCQGMVIFGGFVSFETIKKYQNAGFTVVPE